jgi:hypothetical protein
MAYNENGLQVYQFLRAILRNSSEDKTKITMVYANRYEVQ